MNTVRDSMRQQQLQTQQLIAMMSPILNTLKKGLDKHPGKFV